MIKLHLVPGKSQQSTGIEVPLHRRAHLSDILAKYLLQKYGRERYGRPAVNSRRVVLVGRGGYDEHDPEFMPNPTAQECEATLVARDLGIRDLPELQPILDYTLKVDHFGQGKAVLKFGRLVELMYDVYPDEPWRVERWAEVLIQASIEARRENVDALQPDLVVYPLIRRAHAEVSREFEPPVREKLEEILATLAVTVAVQPFGLPFSVGLLWWKFRNLPDAEQSASVVAWIADALRAELTRQREFLAAQQDYEKGRDFSMTVSGEEIVGIGVLSDNRLIHSYLFHEIDWIAVAAVRRSNGNVQIFRKPRAKVNLELWSVAVQTRAREQVKVGEPVSSWPELVSQRGPQGAAQRWFFHHATQNLYNGSLTAEAEPTALTDEEIRECIVRGLDDEYLPFRRQFYLERGGEVR